MSEMDFSFLPPSAWTPFRQGLCNSCLATCCNGYAVEVSVQDLIRLGETTEAEAAAGLDRLGKRLQNKGVVSEYRKAQMVFVLQQKENGDCRYLNRARKCRVYHQRPQICRDFPKIGPRPSYCPYKKFPASGGESVRN